MYLVDKFFTCLCLKNLLANLHTSANDTASNETQQELDAMDLSYIIATFLRVGAGLGTTLKLFFITLLASLPLRSEERRVGKECM